MHVKSHSLDLTMFKVSLLLTSIFLCLAEGDDIRWEVNDLLQKFKSELEGQLAGMASRLEELVQDLQTHKAANNNLTLEIAQLKREVKELKYSGWTKFGGSCYYMSTGEKSWQQSREFCQNQGADLVVITSREEQDFVNSLRGGKQVWLGLTDRETEGVWKWVDGTPLTSPTYWGPHEPDARDAGEDCVVSVGPWWDGSCERSHYWVCELVF